MRSTIVLIAVILLGSTVPAGAQYFGRNKVQHQRFDFKVLSSEHFDVYYYPEEEAAVRLATRLAERWYSRQKLIRYAAHPHFQQTNVLEGEIGEGTGGVAIAEIDYVPPFDRSRRGWVWQFGLTPGF